MMSQGQERETLFMEDIVIASDPQDHRSKGVGIFSNDRAVVNVVQVDAEKSVDTVTVRRRTTSVGRNEEV